MFFFRPWKFGFTLVRLQGTVGAPGLAKHNRAQRYNIPRCNGFLVATFASAGAVEGLIKCISFWFVACVQLNFPKSYVVFGALRLDWN